MKYIKLFESFSEKQNNVKDIINTKASEKRAVLDRMQKARDELSNSDIEYKKIGKYILNEIETLKLEYLEEISQIMVDVEDIDHKYNISEITQFSDKVICSYLYKASINDMTKFNDVFSKLDDILDKGSYFSEYRSESGSISMNNIIKKNIEKFEIVIKFKNFFRYNDFK